MKMEKKQVNIIVRIVLAAGLFIIGITYSNTSYFQDYPLFGVPFLAEFAIALVLALFGFYTLPRIFQVMKDWAEDLVMKTTYKLVSDFWNEYTTRMEINRKQRQKEQVKKTKQDAKEQLKDGILLDTSILIDGRIIEIAKTGFIPRKLVVPKYVIAELHTLSDSSDNLKREKGRRGLDILNGLKKYVKVIVYGTKETKEGVDKALIDLAKDCSIGIMTLDFNLNKVAKVNGITVLNIHELTEAIKPEFIPGETLKIKVVHEGKEKNQGVGYLPDGTMVVVANGKGLINKNISVEVTKLIQSPAGKMVFSQISQ